MDCLFAYIFVINRFGTILLLASLCNLVPQDTSNLETECDENE